MVDRMGEADRIVGVTSYDSVTKSRSNIGSLVAPNIEEMILLKPDLVLLSEEDSAVQKTEYLSMSGIPYLVLPKVSSFDSVLDNFRTLSQRIGSKNGGKEIQTYQRNHMLQKPNGIKTLFLLSHSPFVAASEHSYIAKIIEDAGGSCVQFSDAKSYPPISRETILSINPDCIITSSPGKDSELYEMFASFTKINFIKNRTAYYISADIICYYTPYDYIESQKMIEEIYRSVQSKLK
jgi:ABC-type Fe3+-hydroxamate transport system substrate-binding protein